MLITKSPSTSQVARRYKYTNSTLFMHKVLKAMKSIEYLSEPFQ